MPRYKALQEEGLQSRYKEKKKQVALRELGVVGLLLFTGLPSRSLRAVQPFASTGHSPTLLGSARVQFLYSASLYSASFLELEFPEIVGDRVHTPGGAPPPR